MATDLTGAANFATVMGMISWVAENALERGTAEYASNKTEREVLTFGEASGNSNQIWSDIRVVAADATDTLDMTATLTNHRGTAITFDTIHAVMIHNRSDETLTSPAHTASAAVIDVLGHADTGLLLLKATGDTLTLAAGDWTLFYFKGGRTVTADTGDILDVIETATLEACYEIIIVGVTAT